jgi:gamma-glutamyl-gamma-aminobutyrate hydrolase PuuD
MSNKKVLLINDRADMGKSYYLPFAFIGPKITDPWILMESPESVALVVFTGGSDVNPEFYNQSIGSKTYIDPARDEEEFAIFNKAMSLDIPIFGICRGLQFLTVQFGGKLVQHVTNHHRQHSILTMDGIEFPVSSSHHQMCLPMENDTILAWAKPRLSNTYLDGDNREIKPPTVEVEAVKFDKVNAIGVQYHPEIMSEKSHGFLYVKQLIEKHMPKVVN